MSSSVLRAARAAASLSTLCLLVACGGGSSSGGETAPTREFIFAKVGTGADATMVFANGTQDVRTRDIAALDASAPDKGLVTVDAGVLENQSLALDTASDVAYANGVVSDARTRYAVYFKGGKLYRLDARVAGTGVPVPTPLSSLQTSEVCASNGRVDTEQLFGDAAGTDRSWLFLPAPGTDGVCFTADDDARAVRLDMDASTPPRTVGRPLAPIYDPATLVLQGMVVLAGNQVQRVDAALGSATNLYTVDPATLRNVDSSGIAPPTWWYFQEGQALWAVDLNQPATRTAVATLQPGENVAATIQYGGGSIHFIQIDTGTTSRIVRLDGAAPAAPAVASTSIIRSYTLTPTRLVWVDDQGVQSALRAGGPVVPVIAAGVGDQYFVIAAAGESVWALRYDFGQPPADAAKIDTLVFDASGAPPTTLADTAIVQFILPNAIAAGPLHGLDLTVVLAEGITDSRDFHGATLRAYRAADRTPKVTYGTIPAGQTGQFTSSGEPASYGRQGMLLAYDVTITQGAIDDAVDAYYFDSDAPGLTRLTRNLPLVAAPVASR